MKGRQLSNRVSGVERLHSIMVKALNIISQQNQYCWYIRMCRGEQTEVVTAESHFGIKWLPGGPPVGLQWKEGMNWQQRRQVTYVNPISHPCCIETHCWHWRLAHRRPCFSLVLLGVSCAHSCRLWSSAQGPLAEGNKTWGGEGLGS